uniref:hypothetical protein n=1 Tax=Pseudomonas fluorescens TaxID=294 RepID=UPI0025B79F43|nr:hypothetical protein [Pseudomonas fluorescens]
METKNVLKTCVGLPEGSVSLGYSAFSAANDLLIGRRIVGIERTGFNTIKFVLNDGLAVSLTPSGIEGDDLDLSIDASN